MTPSTSLRRIEALRQQVVQLEAAGAAADAEYARQAERNASELAAFRQQRSREVAGVMVIVWRWWGLDAALPSMQGGMTPSQEATRPQ